MPQVNLQIDPIYPETNFSLSIVFGFTLPKEFISKALSYETYKNRIYSYNLKFKLIECYSGEIYNDNLHFCSECSLGKYSFISTDQECKNCPLEASFCYKNITEIRPGYWRSPKTLKIYECDQFIENCL